MFEKLVALLPFNPGLAHDLAFYGRRMREEASIRRTGLIFVVLAFMVQFFAVISPPQPTVADSTNDLINGGISSAADAAGHCNSNTAHYGDIMENYGISCQDIANAATTTIKSTDDGNNLFSFGRLPQGATNSRTGKPTGETPVTIAGLGTIYARHLSSFDTNAYSSYKVLVVRTNRAHKTYYILYNCGNLASPGVPVPYTPPVVTPPPTTTPTPVTGTLTCASNTSNITLSFSYANAPNGAIIHKNGAVLAQFPEHTRSGRIDGGTVTTGTTYTYNLQAGGKILDNTTIHCTPKTPPKPVCALDATILATDARCKPCAYDVTILVDNPACKPCTAAVSSSNAEACVVRSKAASNTTRGYTDANNTTAQAGDTIVYTIYAKNTGKGTITNFVFQENLSDVLDYADIVSLHGGDLGNDGTVVWPGVTIAKGATAQQQVTVKVKDVIPQTPASTSDQTHFDLNMANVYGNAVNIHLPEGTPKVIEQVATVLPNTGPGATLAISGSIFLVAGYFYSRSRLLATETDIELKETTSGGL